MAADRGRRRLILLCVALSLLFAVSQGAVWEHQHDEGTTFDLAVGIITKGQLVPTWPKSPLPVTTLYRTVEARTDYDLVDAVESVTVPGYRMFHPPGYYALLHLWTKVFGTTRVLLRLPAYVLAALAILGMAAIARRVIPHPGAPVWVALLFGLSPWVLRITNFARPYHLALFCAVWSTVAVLAMHDEHSRRRWRVLFVVLSLLGLYSLYHYAFVLAWHLAWMAAMARAAPAPRRRALWLALGGVLAALLAGFAPWLRNFWLHLGVSGNSGDYFTGVVAQTHWTTYALRAYQDFAIADAIQTLGGQGLGLASLVLGVLTLPLALWACAGSPRRSLDAPARAFWITVGLLPLLIVASDVWRGSHTIFIPKLCFGLIIPLVLLLVRGWLALPRPWLATAGLGCWALLLGSAGALNTYTRATEPSDMENAAAIIAQADSDDHLVVLSTDLRGYSAPFLLSLRDAGVGNVFVAQAAGHEQLRELLEDVSRGDRFRRVSLVNFMVPTFKGQLMWDQQFLRTQIADPARESRRWLVFWCDRQPWMGPKARLTSHRVPTSFRELWLLGPVRARFYSSPILTEDKLEAARRRRPSAPPQQGSQPAPGAAQGQPGGNPAGAEQPEQR